MFDRRKFVRVPEHLQISYELIPQAQFGKYVTADISRGGIRFFVHTFVAKDSLLKIRLTLEKIPFSFETMVKVQWVKDDVHADRFEIGAEFVNLSRKAVEHLVNYIESVVKE